MNTSGVLFAALLVLGCSPEPETSDQARRVEVPPEAVLASIGALDDSTGVQVMTRAWVASLSETGRFLAVGDRADPFLRILDRATGQIRSFGPKGRGPGELTAAYAMDFLGDSLLLVLSGRGRLERYSTSGEWVEGHRLAELGLRISSITVGCGGRVFAYGIPGNARQLDTVPWVHELHFGTEPSAVERLWIPGNGFSFGYGGLHGFDGNEEGVLLWEKSTEPQLGYWLPCDSQPASLWSHTIPKEEVEEMLTRDAGQQGGSVMRLPDTLFSGASARGTVKVHARRPTSPADDIDVTFFHVVQGEECLEVEVLGEWRLHDLHREGLVVATHDPYPTAQLLDWTWFQNTLTRVPCRN